MAAISCRDYFTYRICLYLVTVRHTVLIHNTFWEVYMTIEEFLNLKKFRQALSLYVVIFIDTIFMITIVRLRTKPLTLQIGSLL